MSESPEKERPTSIDEKTSVVDLEIETASSDVDVTATEAQPPIPTPYDWPMSRKLAIAITVSLAQLVGVSSGSFMAAALPEIRASTNMNHVETQISFVIYMLGLGFAPFVLAPASEIFGRKPVWLFATNFYAICNALCPVGENKVVLIVFRFMSGLGAAGGVTLTGPILADMFRKERRGMAIGIGSLLPYLGPALGPIVGGVLTQYVDWPWLFWMMSLVEAAAIVLGYIVIRETYGPVLRRRQEKKQEGETVARKFARVSAEDKALLQEVRKRLSLPLHMLWKRPVIQIITVINGVDFGIYVLVLSIYATLFKRTYHESPTSSSLHYIAIALGACFASQAGGVLMDWYYARQKRLKHSDGEPEFRIPLVAAGSAIQFIGILWIGWAAEAAVQWIVVDIGAFVFTAGGFAMTQAAFAYLMDEFGDDCASANAAVRIISYMFAFGLPLPAPAMYKTLGYGWGNTLLAGVWALAAVPLVSMLYFRGPKVRAMGRKLRGLSEEVTV